MMSWLPGGAFIQTAGRPAPWWLPDEAYIAKSLLRTRKVGSPHASTSCASGRPRHSLRTRGSADLPMSKLGRGWPSSTSTPKSEPKTTNRKLRTENYEPKTTNRKLRTEKRRHYCADSEGGRTLGAPAGIVMTLFSVRSFRFVVFGSPFSDRRFRR